jgi:hypothetical protein
MTLSCGYFSVSEVVSVATVNIAMPPLDTCIIFDVKGNLNDKGNKEADDEMKKTSLQVKF